MSAPRIILIHGIHNEGPDAACLHLMPYLEALRPKVSKVLYPDYGFILGTETRHINPMVVGAMLPFIEEGDIVVGHSNGCAIGYRLALAGAPIAGLVFINAALEETIAIPPQVKWFETFYNAGDEVTELADVAAHWGVLEDRCWGAMGHAGYIGQDSRCAGNWDCGAGSVAIGAEVYPMPIVSGHSEIFIPIPNLAAWGPFIAQGRIAAHL